MTDRRARQRLGNMAPAIAALAVAALIFAAWAALLPSASAQTGDGPREGETCLLFSQTDRVIAEGTSGDRRTQTIERTTQYLCSLRHDEPGQRYPTYTVRSYTTRVRWTETTGLI